MKSPFDKPRIAILLIVLALVPEHDEAALTVLDQPTFYWHLSESTPHVVNFTLIEPTAVHQLASIAPRQKPHDR